jgi:poly(ADP-ribose) glycohydrolase ARH3
VARQARPRHRTRPPRHPPPAAATLGNDSSALSSVLLALLAFLRNPDDPAQTVLLRHNAGGVTDSTAAMAGALASACNGVTTLPATWLRRFHSTSRLRHLADHLT